MHKIKIEEEKNKNQIKIQSSDAIRTTTVDITKIRFLGLEV